MKVIDLRPDAKLLKPNFDGYKLSLQPIPILKLEDINRVHKIQPNSTSEYSFLHSYLFQLQNHLVSDPWLSNSAYYIDASFTVNKISYDANTGKLRPLISVYKFQSNASKETGDGVGAGAYNAELKFISEKYALISDGMGVLQLIDTGDRQRNDEWKKVDALQPLDPKSFILQDAKFAMDKGGKVIHCLLLHIEHIDEKFYNFVDWISLKEDGGTKKWSCTTRRTLQGKGTLYYLSLDAHCTSIVYSSNHDYKYVFDNVNEIVAEEPCNPPMETENPQAAESVSAFQWSQNGEDITVNFNRIPDATNDMYHVKCLQSHIEVKCDEQELVKSDLFAEIDVDLTTWTLENDFLQLNLIKRNPDLIWPYLIPSGPIEMPPNSKPMQSFNAQPVSDLNAQMEECDYGDEGIESEEYFIERLDSITHKASHKVFLGTNHPLFIRTLRPGFPKAIAIRSDVDCCLWLQHQISASDEWTLKHEGTLHAFGYVQASKRDRKYIMCSPDMNLAVICESTRHLFIYKNSYSTAGGLRNRSGPQLQIGQQRVVSLEGVHGEIFGLNVENDVVMLLTENSVLCLQLAEEE